MRTGRFLVPRIADNSGADGLRADHLPERLRQHLLVRSARWRATDRTQLAAASAAWPIRRSALGHGVHRAARGEPKHVALQAAPLRHAWAVSAHRPGPRALGALQRSRDAAQPPALESAAHAVGTDRFSPGID